MRCFPAKVKMQEFVESSLPSRCLATPEASFLSIWKSENAELAPKSILEQADRYRFLGSCIWIQGLGSPGNLGQTRTANQFLILRKALISPSICDSCSIYMPVSWISIFKFVYIYSKLSWIPILVRITKPSEAVFLFGLLYQDYYIFSVTLLHISFNCIAKLEKKNEDSRFFFLSKSLAGTVNINIIK